MTILITGATGQLGSLVVKHLLDRIPASDIAVSVRKPEKAADLAAKSIDVRAGDFNDLALMTTAFKGIETALIISAEDDNATRIKQHRTAVDAAKAAGVKHIVYTGIVDPKADADFTYSAIHLDTENYIRESGLAFTILRNSFYADLLLAGVPHALETGDFGAPAGDAKITYIPRNDLAEAAAVVLAKPADHVNKTYDLTGTKGVTHTEIAGYIADATGKPIKFVDLPAEVHTGILGSLGLPGHLVEALAGLYVGAKKGDYETVSDDFETLVGRKPQSVENFIQTALAN
ncbi:MULTISPECIES: SDR family oxidoreductase [Thalassospira]|uniref:Nucleoside-diphosphate sugar epimerase n=1 Tax=Thalassospira profundimaris TaxID=502049 RepID=A0A367VDK8_9PROT|nr:MULTISPECIES: SDR family oxidoreductase [Thalassospira]KZB70066.1 NAD(P)-dependent oxidoreductase [Thalassospira sp. MCCC 1A01148]RCK23253.1 nucleoside-diphosphate sugar epimerase [Thalassospira profundimaris]